MNKTLRHSTLFALTAGSLALVNGSAHAAMITDPVAVTLENVGGEPTPLYRSILLFPVDQSGQYIDTVFFNTDVTPGVFVGDETSNIVRPVESLVFLDDSGQPGGSSALLITFPMNNLWGPEEMLSFHFTLNYEEGELWKIDLQLTTVPAPGAIAAFGFTGVALTRRRRT